MPNQIEQEAPEMQQEQGEVSGLEKIAQLAQSQDPSALQQIGEIAQQMLEAQKGEMQEMETEAQAPEAKPSSFVDKLKAAKGVA